MPQQNPPRVLCFVPYGSWLVHNQVDCIIGTALKLRGAEVVLLTCDGLFQEDCYVLAHSKNQKHDCLSCAACGQQFFSHFPLQLFQLRGYTREEDWREIEDWLSQSNIPELSQAVFRGLPIGDWVRTSVRSYHVVNPRNLERPEVQALFRKYIKYAWVTYRAAERFFAEYQPTHLTMFGGYGFLHAPFYEVALKSGCRPITHERGSLPSRFMVAADDLVDFVPALAPVLDAWEHVPITEEEFAQVRSIFLDWEAGKNRSLGAFYKKSTDTSTVRHQLGIPVDAPLLAVFTSGEHELPTEELRREGGKQLDLITHLIEVFRNRDEYLVVRHHPNLGAGIRTRLDYNYLTRAYKQLENLPPNVRIIMPNDRLTSYSILWNASACIAFLSTMTSESVARGLPTAALQVSTFSRLATHVIEDYSFEGMRALTDELFSRAGESFGIADLRKAYAFARTHHLRFATLFKSFGMKNTHEPDIRVTNAEQLLPGHDEALDRVCDFVFNNTTIYDLPKPEHHARDRSIEERLLSSELEDIRRRRKEISTGQIAPSSPPGTIVLMVTESAADGDHMRVTGLTQQRGAPFDYRRIINSDKLLSDVITAIGSSDAEFALVTTPRFRYDEGFLRTETLYLVDSPEMAGIMNGGWVQKGEEIQYYLFTDHNPVSTLDELEKFTEQRMEIADLLGFALLRRSELLTLAVLLRGLKAEEAPMHLFMKLKDESFMRNSVPALRYVRS